MFYPLLTYALVVSLLAFFSLSSNAHSPPARPLKRIDHPRTLSLDILPRQPTSPSLTDFNKRTFSELSNSLRYDDTFRLILSAFDDTFFLHLRPNDHLIHPAARINYYTTTPDGRSVISHTEPLIRESVKVYWGEVIAAHYSPTRLREDAAHYTPQNNEDVLGWARIMIHNQGNDNQGLSPSFEGAFSAKGVKYHIMTKDNYLRTKHVLDPEIAVLDGSDDTLVIWRDSDEMSLGEEHSLLNGHGKVVAPQACGHDRLDFNTDPLQNPVLQKSLQQSSWFDPPVRSWRNQSLVSRDDSPTGGGSMGTNFINSIGDTSGCPKSQKVLYMGVAADCTYVSKYGSQDNATQQILNIWNSASSLYKNTFNVSLGIIELQVQTATCPVTADPAIPWNIPCSGAELDSRLSLFSQWRGNKGADGTGLWHLMSGCPTGSEVGIAWLATLCQQDANGNGDNVVSGTAVSTAARTEWQVVAHEIGHNFGAIHDCADGCTTSSACCPHTSTDCNANAQFIMSPVAQAGETIFSPCSLGNICSVMEGVASGKVNTSCLSDPDPERQTISLKMCGNGIVEKGEDCDPGKDVDSACCDSTTCKFKAGAVCDPKSSPCCTTQCSFAPPTTMCRPSKDSKCDMPEMCTGNSSSCPADITSPNGQSCGNDGLKCASGQCTSIALQCQTVGASMGLQEACPRHGDTSCQVSCQDPTVSNQCILLTSLLIDGSPCGFGGSCLAGKCQSAGALDTAKAWYTQNLQISIPVTIGAAIIAVLLIWVIIRSVRRCTRRRPAIVPIATPSMSGYHGRLSSYDQGAGYVRSPGSRVIPPTPGSGAVYTRIPPATHDRSASGGGVWQSGYNNNDWRGGWVDDAAYNGRR